MSMTLTINETAEFLRLRDDFLIITHRRPDGDTIGCAGALAQGLCEIGKRAYVLHNPETTSRYLQYVEHFRAPDDFVPRTVVTVDIATTNLFPDNAEKYADSVALCIDHHPSNSGYAERTCLDGSRAAGGEVIYDILMTLSGGISQKTAECIYIALSTDTGCFAFANTTANTLRVAALSIEAGAPHREINRRLFRTLTRERIKLEGMIYSALEFYYDGTAAIATITRRMLDDTGADEADLDGIAAVPGSVEGVFVGITIRELSSTQECKVSVRTSPRVSAHELCARFGGGGHPMAAGFSLETTVEDIKRRILEALSEILPLEDEGK